MRTGRSTPPSTSAKWITLFLTGPIEAGAFCLYWNVFKTYEAVGHGFGTVNYWTALGVDFTVSCIISAFALAFWMSRQTAERLNPNSND